MGIDYGRSGCGPFDGMVGRRWIGYYLTAYGLAVKHGFVGTEKEWLESLIGTDGKSVDLRYNEETNTIQWRHQDAEEKWADLLDISTLQTQIVAETLADANAAKIAAEQANTQAQGAKQSSAASAGQAADSAVQAKGSADAALESATAAAKSEQSAKEYAGKPPIVQGDTWHTWNAESQSYTDTGSKVSLTPKGEYSPDTAYTALDVVNHGGSSWMALKDVTGVAPAEGENWMLLAQKGDQGASFTRLEKTAGTGDPGTIDTYTAYNSEGQAAGTVKVYQGMDGTGAGDFKADGTVPMTGNLQMGQHRVTGVADATEDDDAVNKGQMDAALESVTVTTDAAPTEDSTNPVQSGGVFDALAGKADLTLSNLSNRQKALRNIGGRPNRNLLDNWYFVGGGSQQGGGQFPINQRGQTSYTGTGRVFDRWTCSNSNTLIEINSNGVKINNSLQENDAFLVQKIENIGILHGKITLSVLSSASNEYAKARIIVFYNDTVADIFGGGTELSTITVDLDNYENITGLEFRIGNLVSYESGTNLIAAKLELGDHQTLAYQDEDGNWQLFETPNYAEELAKCQRYFQVIRSGRGIGYQATPSICYAPLALPVPLRITPTVSLHGNVKVWSGGSYNVSNALVNQYGGGNDIILALTTDNVPTGSVIAPYAESDSVSNTWIELSAEL